MQVSFVAIFAALAGVAMASPMSLHLIRRCDLTSCAVALGPAAVGCTGAAVEVGANPLADAGCVASALNSVVNPPAACSGCGSDPTVTGIESAVGGAVDDVKSAIGSIF
ncbi:hypothetical protein JB92DRAFT_2831198 [Gautieria morchelliformis]|nr:hypothetical protein JB92DRAFT_2831198 [Gautieria morchelliformis]